MRARNWNREEETEDCLFSIIAILPYPHQPFSPFIEGGEKDGRKKGKRGELWKYSYAEREGRDRDRQAKRKK